MMPPFRSDGQHGENLPAPIRVRAGWSNERPKLRQLKRSSVSGMLRDYARELRFHLQSSGNFELEQTLERVRARQMKLIRSSSLGH